MPIKEDSGRHRSIRDEDRLRRLNERLVVLEATQKQLLLIIQMYKNATLGFKAAAQLGKIIKWFLIVGAATVAIWAAFTGKRA